MGECESVFIKGQCWYYERVFLLKDSVGIMRECFLLKRRVGIMRVFLNKRTVLVL